MALVEASWRLGDRSLRHVAPHLRGDDVEALQTRLARVGFDCGKVDGIFGPDTARALERFQRQSGLTPDGICGPETVRALHVYSTHSGTGPGVAALRELANLTAHGCTLDARRIVVGHFGGLSRLSRRLTLALRQHGANAISVQELEPSAQAQAANRHHASIYLGLSPAIEPPFGIAYYRTEQTESPAGRSLAEQIAATFRTAGALDLGVSGIRHPVLRETRMPAVLCTIGPMSVVNGSLSELTDLFREAISAWVATTTDATPAAATDRPR